jgi:predicted AAA+ superfamily ATPase
VVFRGCVLDLELKRDIYQSLTEWKQKSDRKPLILMGARQVGKTYTLKHFGCKHYKHLVYVNFEHNKQVHKLFEQTLEPRILLKALSVELNIEIVSRDTLIVFDEVQECPSALNSLKYFNEKAPELHIAAAGSLLGVTLAHTHGFPVGQVDFLTLYPLTFKEFLAASDQQQLIQFYEAITTIDPLPETIHLKLMEMLKAYIFVGGMPGAVSQYSLTGNFDKVREVQEAILNAYKLDFAKHAPAQIIMRINQVWSSIPAQLAKENKKFIYSLIRKGARAKEFETAIQWLTEAGLIYKAYHLSTPQLPLEAYTQFEFFKIYLFDVGLLGAMTNLSPKAVIYEQQLLKEFKGAMTENYVAQVLAKEYRHLYYWTSEGKAELDFILQHNDVIYPVEVKSGNSARKKSLQVYGSKYQAPCLIRTSPKNLKQDKNLLNCPLYLLDHLSVLL